jgi:hypothetical protein
VVCLAPRARGDSVRPPRLSGVGARPLNFAVRGQLRCSASPFGNSESSASSR